MYYDPSYALHMSAVYVGYKFHNLDKWAFTAFCVISNICPANYRTLDLPGTSNRGYNVWQNCLKALDSTT